MENELSIKNRDAVALIRNQGIDELIKPLRQEILLLETYIAGTTKLEDKSILNSLKEGSALILQREENRFDDKAILVLDEKQHKLGYVPEKDNTVFARLMDAGKCLTAKVTRIEPKSTFRQINIAIYLVDF